MSATRRATKAVKDSQAKVRCHSWVPSKESNRSSKIRAQGFLGTVFCLSALLTGSFDPGVCETAQAALLFPSNFVSRCPKCPGQPRWPCPVRESSDWQSPRPQPPYWKSGTPCQNPSHMCQTITAYFSWPVSGSQRVLDVS